MRISDWSSDVCSSDLIAFLAVDEAQGDGLAGGAVEDDQLHLPRQVGPGGVEGEAELPGEGAENLHVIGAGRVGLGPGDDGALLEAEGFVGGDEFGVELLPFAQAVAGGAGALGGVEGEEARFDRQSTRLNSST